MVSFSPRPPASQRRVVPSTRVARWLALSLPLVIAGCYSGHPGGDPLLWENDGETAAGDDETDGQADAEDDGTRSHSDTDAVSDGGADDTADPDDGTSTGADGNDDAADGVDVDDTGDGSGDDGMNDDGGDDGNDAANPDDVPNIAYCQDASIWSAQWAQLEEEILFIVNVRRAEGANCGTKGSFGAAPPVTMNKALRCAARIHSKDMAVNDYFSHTNQQGQSPFDRMKLAGYNYTTAGENIAAGNSTAAATMEQWMKSDGHCANLMNPNFKELGVGYHPGGSYNHYWTQKFGRQ